MHIDHLKEFRQLDKMEPSTQTTPINHDCGADNDDPSDDQHPRDDVINQTDNKYTYVPTSVSPKHTRHGRLVNPPVKFSP